MDKNFLVEVEDEDHLIREAVKSAAYNYESHGDPAAFQRHLEELLEGSKARYRDIFAKYGYGKQSFQTPAPGIESTQ